MTSGESVGPGLTKWEQLAHDLRVDIAAGTYPVGHLLPSRADMAVRYGGPSATTVKRALLSLEAEGLIVSRGQGSRARVLAVPGEQKAAPVGRPNASGPTEGSLSDALKEAFASSEVTLDVLSLTSETLSKYVGELINQIEDGRTPPPESITVRLLLPATSGIRLAFPISTSNPDAEWARDRHRAKVIWFSKQLDQQLTALQYQGRVKTVSVQIRTVPFTPPLKVYLLNKQTVLEGYYILTEWAPPPDEWTPPLVDGRQEATILDSLSTDSKLFVYTRPNQASKVDEAQKFFDSYWDRTHLVQEVDTRTWTAPTPPRLSKPAMPE